MKIGVATRRRNQVLGVHFFNPVPERPSVELVASLLAEKETMEGARACVLKRPAGAQFLPAVIDPPTPAEWREAILSTVGGSTQDD